MFVVSLIYLTRCLVPFLNPCSTFQLSHKYFTIEFTSQDYLRIVIRGFPPQDLQAFRRFQDYMTHERLAVKLHELQLPKLNIIYGPHVHCHRPSPPGDKRHPTRWTEIVVTSLRVELV